MTGGDDTAGSGQQPLRNAIHLATGIAAPWLLFVPGPWNVAGLAAVAAFAVAVDLGRLDPRFLRVLETRLPGVYRPTERFGVSGATLLAVGYVLAALLLPAPAAAGGILALAVGDPAAAIVGRRYGTGSRPGGKTWPGSLACFAATWPVLWLMPAFGAPAALAGAAMAALIERRAGRLDNLLLPVGVGALLNLWLP